MRKQLLILSCLLITSLLLSACNLVTIDIGDGSAEMEADQSAQQEDQPVEETSDLLLPKMILVDTDDGYGLTLYNLQGQPITELKTPNIGYAHPNRAHLAGPIPEGPIMTPLVYHSFETPESLLIKINDSISTLREAALFYGMVGAPGDDLIAYSGFDPSSESVISNLFVGDLETLPTTGPVYTMDNSENYFVLNPVSIYIENGVALQIWFTTSAWGIGGDIIFAPNQGLYYFDMTDGNTYQLLDNDCSFQGLSADFTWAACQAASAESGYEYTIHNLKQNTSIGFPLDSASERGAGYGSFSPDSSYVGWLEASGSHMSETPDYKSRIRIGNTTGGIIFDKDDSMISQEVGVAAIPYMFPIGWIDTKTMLVQAELNDYTTPAILKINIMDGSVTKLVDGRFIDFGYP